MIKSIRRIRRAKPAVFTILKTFDEIRLRVIASIKIKNRRPPSSAGKGKRFMIDRLIDISAVKVSK